MAECPLTPLACGKGCRIDRCDHGTIHLTVGDVTLRLPPSRLAALSDLLSAAQIELMLQDEPANRLRC
jgi:hypothetical protein